MADLHAEIMNIPADHEKSNGDYKSKREAYIFGHRDARHAAAELALSTNAGEAAPVAWCMSVKAPKPWFGKGWTFSPVQTENANMPLYAHPPAAVHGQSASIEGAVTTCWSCGGSGIDGDVGRDGQTIDIPCGECDGTGRASLAAPAAEVQEPTQGAKGGA